VLGQGEPALHEALRSAAQANPGAIATTFGYDEGLAHLIEAGADCFLMPSRFEPCGLNQMYSQAYGTPPIVSPTGGLVDSVVDATADPARGTGFVMSTPDAAGFLDALQRAMQAYRQPAQWRRIQANGMARDFGWERSAAQYVQVYERAMQQAAAG
jgi:starch synthase